MFANLSKTQGIGRANETRAQGYFARRGWKLLHKNYLCKAGEVDLIFEDPEGAVVFVEVKYRASSQYGAAEEFVGLEKQMRTARAAMFYIKQRKLSGRDFRFDVAAVSPQGVAHIPNAFSPEGYTL